MRAHFRFLKEQRRLLNLKLNAAEDLLINGVREPTHRGICQHLLDKVERSRVELVVTQLDPAARARLLEGIIAFSPDPAYLLLYLESLRAGARPDAAAALTEALKHIDFASISAAQMRRVLDLVVELVDERDRPQLLFSLLQSETFQTAFDKSAERLPQALADIVVPLRAAHAVIVRGARNPADASMLARGVEMLLKAQPRVLKAQSEPVRKRLFDAGIELAGEPAKAFAPGLRALVESFSKEDRQHGDAAMALAGWLLGRGLETEARSLLAELKRDAPNFRAPARWLEALEARRVGPVGLVEHEGKKERDRFVAGVLLRRQQPVWVRLGTSAEAERFERAVELARSLVVPGVAPVLESGTHEGCPFLVLPKLGRPANELLLKGGLEPDQALRAAAEGVRILWALAAEGVKLPDARFRRFALDAGGRLWLRDLLEAERVGVDAARAAHLPLARDFAVDVLTRAEKAVPPEALIAKLREATDASALVRLLDEA